MAHRRSNRVFTRPPAKTKVWIGASIANTVVAASTFVKLTTLTAAALALRPFTILRTRQVIWYASDQAAASEFGQGIYARIIVTESAATAGVGSIPSPIDEPEAAFYVYEGLMQNFLFGDGTGFTEVVGRGSHTIVDSKSMRKVGIDDDVVGVFHNRSATGAEIAIEGRQLIQLH